MKFYNFFNTQTFGKLIENGTLKIIGKELERIHVALTEFEESSLADILQCYIEYNNIKSTVIKENISVSAIGEDGYLYAFSPKDFTKKRYKRVSRKIILKRFDSLKRDNDYLLECDKIVVEQSENAIKSDKNTISCYKKFTFANKDKGQIVKFRFKKARGNKKAPLLVYFHGAGASGHDNLLQYLEFHFPSKSPKLKNCHILLPQARVMDNSTTQTINDYVDVVKDLIDQIVDEYNVDKESIYIIGISFGGACVWSSLYRYPDFFAAGIPTMGGLSDYNEPQFDINKFRGQNIWIAHSSNDINSNITNDDVVYEQLKAIDCNVKYSRWKHFGHSMCTPFFMFCRWKKWLFSQKNNRNKL